MKTRIFALCLAALMLVAGTAPQEAHAFGGPLERAVIQAIRNAGARLRARRSRRVSSVDVQPANPSVWL